MQHLWRQLDLIRNRIMGSELVLLSLDFDGTLAAIASTPQEASLPERTKAVLRSLSSKPRFRVAIVSGRAVEEVRTLVGIESIIYAGNHGMELLHPQGRWTHPEAVALRPALEEALRALKSGELGRIPGLLIEDKGLIVSIHYRRVADEPKGAIEPLVQAVLEPFRGVLRLAHGKQVLELRPNLPCHKGKALLSIARLVDADGKGLIIYIGDDQTDEDAFAALGPEDIGIRVGQDATSRAGYFLRDTDEVVAFLEALIHWFCGVPYS